MATRKIDLMYEMFGRGEGYCKDCKHFDTYQHHDYQYSKCKIYGVTSSEATDWKQKYEACGLFNKDYEGDVEIVKLVSGNRSKEEQVQGQMSLF